MSFRNLSILFITLLLTSVLLLQWWSISNFSQTVSKQIGESAFEVSRTTAETLIIKQPTMQFKTVAISSNKRVSQQQINQLFNTVKQDVHIELKDEQQDNFMLLNADGTEFKIPIPRTGIHLALDEFSNKVLYSTLLLLLCGILLAVYFIHKITSPLKKLQNASMLIGSGNLGHQIIKDNQWHSQEIDQTIDSFNQMSSQINLLQQQNKALQDKAHFSELAEVTRGLAHTIRNPLNTLNLAIDELQTIDLSQSIKTNDNQLDKKRQLSKLAKHQITRIDKWVRSLMDVMSNDNKLIQSTDLISLIDNVIHDLKLSSSKSLTFDFNYKTNKAEIKAIHSELKGLLQSLIANAVETSPAKSKITIVLNQSGLIYQISITDQGAGFSEKILSKLFSPHNTNKTYGAGMGLYLAERIIRTQYAGQLSIKNNTSKGATVNLSLTDRSDALSLNSSEPPTSQNNKTAKAKQFKADNHE